MTDSRSKTKANSTVALNRHRRGSSSINTITNNDDTDNLSDIDTQTIINAVRDIAKNPLKSPWQDEKDLSTNEEDLNVLRTPDKPITMKRSVTTGRIARKNSINKNLMERSIQRSNQGQRIKCSTVGKTQKYHWSGTFRSKRNLFSKDRYRDTLYSLRDNEPNKLDDQPNYNYYNKDFEKKKLTSEKDIFYPNFKFDSRTNGDSWRNKWLFDDIDYQPTEYCNESIKFDRFKGSDIEQNNGMLPISFSDINVTSRRMTDVDNKNMKMCNIDSRTNERDNTIISYSQFTYNDRNINKEEYSNICSAKELIDSSINIEIKTRKMDNDTKKKSAIRCCYKVWYFLMSLLKNAILFLLLPVVYIIFFIYVQKEEETEKETE